MILYFPQQSFYKHVPRLQRTKRYEDTQNYLKTWSSEGDVCHSIRLKATGTLCTNIFFKFDFQILKKTKCHLISRGKFSDKPGREILKK